MTIPLSEAEAISVRENVRVYYPGTFHEERGTPMEILPARYACTAGTVWVWLTGHRVAVLNDGTMISVLPDGDGWVESNHEDDRVVPGGRRMVQAPP